MKIRSFLQSTFLFAAFFLVGATAQATHQENEAVVLEELLPSPSPEQSSVCEEIEDKIDAALAEGSEDRLLLQFTADWCSPCRIMKRNKVIQKVARDISAEAIYVDVDECPELSQEFNVRGIPDVRYLREGEDTGFKATGNVGATRLKAAIQAHIDRMLGR